ncbi:uncharacterized protein EHS24_009029 [Apiotrichum porosum]|uniref:CFEM domain-containing protein n=1 Tax=Apiotrichum porosum TaxID=105984 RepID=A0A427XNF7_9TREE|nr:uncharacterized protein EHS24_009029 [Apiotrichum porosum]RSH80449.1 hypothetical protein EHS24_009029 [Apiotrichum porosum]
MKLWAALALTAVASVKTARADAQSDYDALPACAITCLEAANTAEGCTGISDTSCVCTSSFQNSAATCLVSSCSSAISAVLALQSELCDSSSSSSAVTSASETAAVTTVAESTTETPSSTPTDPVESVSETAAPTEDPVTSEPATSTSAAQAAQTSVAGVSECASSCLIDGATSQGSALALQSSTCSAASSSPASDTGSSASQTGSPTSSAAAATSSSASIDLSTLSTCSLTCILGAISSQGCTGPTDTACICTEAFTNAAASCLTDSCTTADIIAALDLESSLCPDLGLPDLDSIGSCAQACVIDNIAAAGCSGPLDTDCLCGVKFELKASTCLIQKCNLTDLAKTLTTEIKMCLPSGGLTKCTASGVFKLLEPSCWFSKRDSAAAALQRRGTAAVKAARIM